MERGEPAPPRRLAVATRALRRGTFASLSLGQFRLLLCGTASSQVASWMEIVARGWLVLELTHSPFQLGLFEFIRGLTSLAVSPIAGVVSDRLDRRIVAGVSQVVPALAALTIGLLVVTDTIALWHLYLVTGIVGVSSTFNFTARQVLVYDVVGPDYITNAIALNSVTANVARIGAPSVGGLIVATAGVGDAYFAQAAFFLLATVATLALRPYTRAEPVRVPMWQGMRDGAGYVRRDPVLRRLVLLNAIPNLLIYPYVALMPFFAEDVLGVGSTGYGVLLSAVGFGSIPGGLIAASMTGSQRKGRVMAGAAILYMGMVALFGLSQWFPLSFALLIAGGVGWSLMVTLNQTLLQLNVSDAYRGRVLAFYNMASGITPFGSLAMGTAADHVGVQRAVTSFALAGLALSGYVGLGSARIRRL
jgi:predicted MFS family arabinose efflux permease